MIWHRAARWLCVWALYGAFLAVLACSADRPRLSIDIDYAGCAEASCVDRGWLTILKGATLDSACLLTHHEITSASGMQLIQDDSLTAGEELVLVLAVQCPDDPCAKCAAVEEGLRLEDGAKLTLSPMPQSGCIDPHHFPGGTSPTACDAPDAGPSAEEGPTGLSCAEVGECAEACESPLCVVGCQTKACPSALPVIAALTQCIEEHCPQCENGFTESCNSCLQAHCTAQYADCLTNRC